MLTLTHWLPLTVVIQTQPEGTFACAVDNMAAPSSRTPADLAALLLHTRRLIRDASTMPALGAYIHDYHKQLEAVRTQARLVRRSAKKFEQAVGQLNADYCTHDRLPPYYFRLLEAYETVVRRTYA